MKSRKRISIAMFAAASALILAGCGPKAGDDQAHEAGETEVGVTFNAKKGLLIPAATARFIDLQLADVSEQKIAATFQFSARVYRAGNEVRPAGLTLGGLLSMWASGAVTPAEAAKLHEGQGVTVQYGDAGNVTAGRIVTVRRELEKSTGQVEILLAIPDVPNALASGGFLSVIVPFGGEKSVVGVPRAAVFRTTEGDFVYTVSGEHFMRAPVKLGIVNEEFAEITDGLYTGDQIVVRPVMTLWMAELQSLRGGKACADGH